MITNIIDLDQLIEYLKIDKRWRVVIAAGNGDLDGVKRMLQIDLWDFYNRRQALKSAMFNKHTHIVEFLLEYEKTLSSKYSHDWNKIDTYNESLKYFSSIGDIDIVKYIIDLATEGGVKLVWNFIDPVINAASNGYLDIVKLLVPPLKNQYTDKYILGGFMDINSVINHAMTGTSENGHIKIVEFLLDYIIDLNNIISSIVGASKGNFVDIVKLLLDHYDINNHIYEIKSHVMGQAAIEHCSVDVVNLLLELNIDYDYNELLVTAIISRSINQFVNNYLLILRI